MSLDIIGTVMDLQRAFHERIAFDLTALHEGGSPAAFVTLAGAGFLYGILHAVGPGHGKVVISGYMLADDHTLKRGLFITAASSLMQAVVAIALVLVLFYGLGLAREKTEYAAAWFECASFGLVALIGAVLFMRGVSGLSHRGHTHGPDCEHCHTPDAAHVRAAHGPAAIATMIASVGMRPCSGALLLMFFSCLMGEIWAGIAATFAMAVGTAITTGAIAAAAASSRKGLLKIVGQSEARVGLLSALVKIAGGLLIFTLTMLFFYTSWPSAESKVIAPYNHPLMGHRG
jgi:ABC-type nickel/cobalt efflux system permease component RcnA